MTIHEQFTNDVVTTLDGAINDSVTSIDVADATGYPTDGNFRIQIGSETMTVTEVSSDTLTVIRETDGTTAASHDDGDDVRMVLSSDSIKTVFNQVLKGGAIRPPHSILDADGDPITASDFSWDNQGGATLTDTGYAGLRLTIPANASSHSLRIATVNAPTTTPWRFRAHVMLASTRWVANNFDYFGICVRDSATDELVVFRLTAHATLIISAYSDATSFDAHLIGAGLLVWYPAMWLEIEDDGTDLTFRSSSDGVNWFDVVDEGRTVRLTNGPDEIGLFGNGASGGGYDMVCTSFTCIEG